MNEKELIKSMSETVRAIRTDFLDDVHPLRKQWWKFCWWVEDINPFTKYVEVSSYEEYAKLPRSQRTFAFLWYHHPLFGSNVGWNARDFLGRKEDREAAEAFLQYKFPIQYYLRENLYYKIIRGYDKLRYFLNPRQNWLKKQIPNEWQDKVTLIKDLNFAMVVHFVDGEKCFESTDYEGSGEHHAKFAKELKECYDYIKNQRPSLEKLYWDSYPKDGNYTGDYEADYGDTNRLEKQLEDNDTKWLTWIVTNRNYFWT